MAAGAAAIASSNALVQGLSAAQSKPAKLSGNVNHSVCKWCYKNIPLEEFCQAIKKMGIVSVDLLGMDDAPVLRKHGLTNGVMSGVPGGITKGLNRLEHHDAIVEYFETAIPFAAKEGYRNVICFSGNRNGMDDQQGLENCAIGLKRIAPLAEKHGVYVIMELLNSKRNHKDYMCDRTPWGVELCKLVGSERFKLLYDIYHMQIMEGDVIDTIREFHPYFAHYHTGGVPGRNEIDESQELYYPAIMKAIVATGYDGFVAQEFIPASKDPLASLAQAIRICDV